MTAFAQKHIAVVLFNLGGPDSREAIRPFLINFFSDPNIIRAPKFVRYLLSRFIAFRRSRREAGDSYAKLGNASPLLENTRAQASALALRLNTDPAVRFSVHVCMRYWHPMAEAVVERVKHENPDQVILLPLYPQFSTTTTWSSLGVWRQEADAVDLDIPTSMICCYPMQGGFVTASAGLIRAQYDAMAEEAREAGLKPPRVLFSAHGLPEDIIVDGDPYQWQCERSAQAIADAVGVESLDWQVCYQSRVGPKKWIGPSTEDALRQAAADGVPVLVYPHAFVSEHVETLVEIEEEYRELAQHLGVPLFDRVPTVGVTRAFIEGLAQMVLSRMGMPGIGSDRAARLCPSGFSGCCMGRDVVLPYARACSVPAPQV